MLQFGTKNSRHAWHVIPAQEVKYHSIASDIKLLILRSKDSKINLILNQFKL